MLDTDSARALEESLLDPAVRQSPEWLASLIADDFVEFGSSGRIFGKQQVLDGADTLPDIVTPLEGLDVSSLGDDVVLITYRSTTRLAGGSTRDAVRSSLWIHRDGRWQIRFHQGTSASG